MCVHEVCYVVHTASQGARPKQNRCTSVQHSVASKLCELHERDEHTTETVDFLIEAIWASFDDQAELAKDDFLRALLLMDIEVSTQEAIHIFNCVDIDESGSVSKNEFKLWWLNSRWRDFRVMHRS
jgi:hypothetical protein